MTLAHEGIEKSIEVISVREHNLKDVSVRISKDSIVVFTGISGSGKSSLVFDTVYAEAQRQLIETFSSFARGRLLDVVNRLVDGGNTVLVIEHNLDVIKHADWVIDMGPEGGEIIAEGTPEQIAQATNSYTGQYLAKTLH